MKNVQTEEEQVLEAVLKAMEFVVHVRLIESYTAVIAKLQIYCSILNIHFLYCNAQ